MNIAVDMSGNVFLFQYSVQGGFNNRSTQQTF